jgi:putative salt-induced outer membrane protein
MKYYDQITIGVISSLLLVNIPTGLSAQDEEKPWKAQAVLGLNLTSGNSDSRLYNGELSFERKSDKHEVFLKTIFAYGKTEDEVSEDNGKLSAQYNNLLNKQIYLYINTDIEYDEIAMLDYRLIAGPGIGHYFIKSDALTLKAEIGASYLQEKIDLPDTEETEVSVDDDDDAIALRVTQQFEWHITKTSKIWESVEYLPEFEDFDIWILNSEIGVESAINTSLNLRVSLLNQYDSNPAPGIKENDLTLKAGLVFNL